MRVTRSPTRGGRYLIVVCYCCWCALLGQLIAQLLLRQRHQVSPSLKWAHTHCLPRCQRLQRAVLCRQLVI